MYYMYIYISLYIIYIPLPSACRMRSIWAASVMHASFPLLPWSNLGVPPSEMIYINTKIKHA